VPYIIENIFPLKSKSVYPPANLKPSNGKSPFEGFNNLN
jgi:hypothetical protein